MAAALGDLGGRLSVAVGRVQRPLGARTLQQEAGDALEPVLGGEVEQGWHICMVEL